jgi:hypothetical protein
MAIRKGKHVFVEKPLAHTLQEGKDLVNMVREAGVKMQVGHVERFNPAYLALKELNHVVNAFKRNQFVFDIGTQILHQLFDYFVTLPV